MPTHMKTHTREETYKPALDKARREIAQVDPWETAFKAAVDYREIDPKSGEWIVPFWGKNYRVTYPNGVVIEEETGKSPSIVVTLLILHYLLTAEGVRPADYWVSFRVFPGGQGYWPVFQARTALKLAKAFGKDKEAFEKAALALGGERLSFGDSSFLFRMFPRLWLAVVLNLADEELGPSAQILFDATANSYLPTEDLVVLSEMLTHSLLKQAGKK